MATAIGNIFAAIPQHLQDELFEPILQQGSLKIERIVSKGHTSPPTGWYDQASDEWVILLAGEAVLSFEQANSIRLKPGDYLEIPAHTKHKVSWTDPDQETVWLAIHY